MSLREALATPEAKRRYVRTLFHAVADRYDLITVVLSFGRDRRWKERLVALAEVRGSPRTLDLACGTGDLAFLLAHEGASVVGLDIVPRMVELARRKAARMRLAHPSRPTPRFLVGDMMALPFPPSSFDLVTTGYGLRNVPVIEPALGEIYRVLKPGGRLLALDFNRPDRRLVRLVYLAYLTIVGSALGIVLHKDPDTYRYIPETIRRYPGAESVAQILRHIGFRDVGWVPILGGLLAIHYATR